MDEASARSLLGGADIHGHNEVALQSIGRRLRAERAARRLTLSELGAQVGITKGFLSKLERDQAVPSVATLVRICNALNLGLGELFEDNHEDLVRANRRPPINFGGVAVDEALLTPSDERRIQAIYSNIAPGGGSGHESYELPVDVGFVFILVGTLELRFARQEYILETGDALTFQPSEPHSFRNASGTLACQVMWLLTPALPAGHDR